MGHDDKSAERGQNARQLYREKIDKVMARHAWLAAKKMATCRSPSNKG
jgi:protein involved in temperature-dependent protein secretion